MIKNFRGSLLQIGLLIACCIGCKLSFAQSTEYKIYALDFAHAGYPFTEGDWSKGAPKTKKVDITFMIWLIKGDSGRNILVDAGFLNDIEDAKDFQIRDYMRPDSALRRFGIDPASITDIIISHPHFDHIDGVSLFPGATLWMQKDDYNFFVGEAWQAKDGNGGFNKRNVKYLVDVNLAGKLKLVDGDNKQIIKGITVYTGSRHTFNSQYVLVNTGSKNVILASDNIWIYYSLNHMVPPSDGGTLDQVGYVNAMKRMKTMVRDLKYIIPGHDGKLFDLFPKVGEGVIEIK